MLEWLTQLGDFILMVVNFVVMFLTSTVNFLLKIPRWLTFLQLGTTALPGIIAPFALTGIMLTAILLIIGRH